VAVGIGFGAAEAILLGLMSLLNVLIFILLPDYLSSLPQATQDAVQTQLSWWFIPIPVIERLTTLVSHVFATVLALFAVRAGAGRAGIAPAGKKWLALSMAIGVLIDGSIFWLAYFIPSSSVTYTIVLEALVAAIAAVSMYGLYRLKKRYDTHAPQA
jgi:uncharacterized membrane protein YhfC